MRAEFRLVFIMALLVSATLFLILQSPDGTPESLLLERHSREIVQIHEDSKNYHLLGDDQGFNASKKSMQEKLKEAAFAHMGLEVSSVDLIDGYYRLWIHRPRQRGLVWNHRQSAALCRASPCI